MQKKLKIMIQLSEVDRVRLKYANASLILDPEFYDLPEDLTNMTKADETSIINQVKIDLSMKDLHRRDYRIMFREPTIFMIPKDFKVGGGR